MARTRAVRRAAREAERRARIEAARARNESKQRRAARVDALRTRLRLSPRPGLVAANRRRRARVLIFLAVLANVLIWLVTPDVAARGFAAVVTLLIAPMFAVLVVGRSR
jgi:Flp pilus assembly protein TadB